MSKIDKLMQKKAAIEKEIEAAAAFEKRKAKIQNLIAAELQNFPEIAKLDDQTLKAALRKTFTEVLAAPKAEEQPTLD